MRRSRSERGLDCWYERIFYARVRSGGKKRYNSNSFFFSSKLNEKSTFKIIDKPVSEVHREDYLLYLWLCHISKTLLCVFIRCSVLQQRTLLASDPVVPCCTFSPMFLLRAAFTLGAALKNAFISEQRIKIRMKFDATYTTPPLYISDIKMEYVS